MDSEATSMDSAGIDELISWEDSSDPYRVNCVRAIYDAMFKNRQIVVTTAMKEAGVDALYEEFRLGCDLGDLVETVFIAMAIEEMTARPLRVAPYAPPHPQPPA